MRAVVQRVSSAAVEVEGETVGRIERGLLLLVGVGRSDDERTAASLAAKVAKLRVFADDDGKMNLSVRDVDGAVLLVSQFTLQADTSGGNRPSFAGAAEPKVAEPLIAHLAQCLRSDGLQVEQGRFGAHMRVSLVNDGPVTIWLEV